MTPIPFLDLHKQYQAYHQEIQTAIQRVLDSSCFIGGSEVYALEEELSQYCGTPYTISCANGTDALRLALMALEVGPGDEVIVPDFTFVAPAEAVALCGATPVFADVSHTTFTVSASTIKSCISPKTKAVIAVSLFGQCSAMDSIQDLCNQHDLFLIEDAAQSFGSVYRQKKSGNLSLLATTSFFPSKPLGAFGDGGAVFCQDKELAQQIRLLANHGQTQRGRHEKIGFNSRLDALQAAVLRVKLQHLDHEIILRQNIAQDYNLAFQGIFKTPEILYEGQSVWAQYTLQHPQRDTICAQLKQRGIPTAIYYPEALRKQKAFTNQTVLQPKQNKYTDLLCSQVFSLPLHAYLSEYTQIEDEVHQIMRTLNETSGKNSEFSNP